ncbi:hypothetical protein GSI_15668 [Ganoderma sinense ZZ0214-1]|uniref:Transporter n=1 Tax=Ganoderma sinense ZZ0214-1 TaxID=1077348 RepID=A0A2G8RN93_9APHY|nr:hypothetical protein GSI_15668 [Ganoderma sinense ZZ0214-1]
MARHPRVVACTVATLLLCTISATVLVSDVGVSFGSSIPVLSGVQPLENASDPRSTFTIGLALTPTSIDLSSSSLAFNWWATACGPTSDTSTSTSTTAQSASTGAAELVVPGLQNVTCGRLYESFSVSVDFNPVYMWNASETVSHANGSSTIQGTGLSFTPQETFDTTHNFTWISTRQSLAQRRQHSVSAWYPFDRYTVSTTVEAFDLGSSDALPVEFVHLYAGLSGYELRVDSLDKVKTAQSDEALYIAFSIRRCKGVKLFAVTLFLTNYILAAAMVWVAVCAYYGPPLPSETALFLPLANILLLPQLRAAMPGVPDFGIFMDLFGYYVNIVAVRMRA